MSTILLVDDDPDILKLISLRLTAAGHSVKGADSGEKALAVLAASRPELVITDLKMGGMDGLTLFDEIRKQAPTLPVIILTAHGTIPEAVAGTLRCGQLRGHPGKPARIRIVRPPQRLVYRCELRSQGAHPRRRRRDAVFG